MRGRVALVGGRQSVYAVDGIRLLVGIGIERVIHLASSLGMRILDAPTVSTSKEG